MTFVQRFGDALNLHVHFHALLPDGVWTEADGALVFRTVSAPTDGEVERVCATVGRRVTRLLQRRGLLDGEDEAPDVLASLQAKAILAALVLHQPGEPEFQLKRRCAALDGYSVHANTAIAANDREGLERLCRYGARPSLSLERMRRLDDGNIGYRLKRVIGQTGELVLTPNELMGRLVTLVPPPRAHLVRYHGVFAPNARLRPKVVLVPKPPVSAAPEALRPRGRIDWASLLKRVFKVDVLACTRCDGRLSVIAYLTDRAVVRRILGHLGLPMDPPPRGRPARERTVDVGARSDLPAWMGETVQTEFVWLDLPVDVATLPTWMRPQVAGAARGDGALAEGPPRWLDEVDAPVDVAALPAWMRGPLAVAPADTEARPLDLPESSVDVRHLPAWMRPPRPPAEARPRAWEDFAEVESNVSDLPRWMQPAPVPEPRQRQATDDLAFGDEVDPAQLPTWMRTASPQRPYRHGPFDRPAPEEGSQVPPQWGEDVDDLPAEEAALDPVVDLARLPRWMTSQGYVPIQPTLNSRSRLRVNSEGESTRGWRAEWDWQRPAQVQVELEVESQALVEPEFVDTAVSDLPAEVDLAALPRWMRAVPEQGPPEELEFEAGRGPAEEWD